ASQGQGSGASQSSGRKTSKGAVPTTTTSPQTSSTATTGTTTTAAAPKTPDQAVSDARENLADDITHGSAAFAIGQALQLAGGIALLVGFTYTALWAMRTGLLTRGMGIFGIAAGLLTGIPLLGPISGVVPVVWFATLGLSFVGVRVTPLPPAWAAGEAIPWRR